MQAQSPTVEQYLASMPALGNTKRDQQRLARLMSFCEGLPEVVVAPAGERHLGLTVGRKTFAYYLNRHHDDGKVCICCKSTLPRQRQLVARDPRQYHVPAYLRVSGWVSLRLDLPRVAWDEAHERIIEAYRLQAPRRLAAEME